MPNIHAFGAALNQVVRSEAAAHRVSYKRVIEGEPDRVVGPICASSGPIGQQLLTETGLDITDQQRVFYLPVEAIVPFLGYPKLGDIVIDHCDGSEWKVLPMDDDYAWRFHGQTQTSFAVKTKQDK